jgi:hypothetical protein
MYKETKELIPRKIYYDREDGEKLKFVKYSEYNTEVLYFSEVPKGRQTIFSKIGGLIPFPKRMTFYKICTILIALCITCSAFAQYDNYGHLTKKHKIISDKSRFIALATTSIILNGIGDGLNANPKTKPAGHIFTAAAIGALVATPLLVNYNKRKWYVYALSYGFLRAGLFDATYNTTRHLPYNYSGNSCLWDKFWRKAGGRNILDMGLSLSVGVFLPLNEL